MLERGRLLPAGELREIADTAGQTAATMAATANEIVAMERAAGASPQSRAHLTPTIQAFTAQLHQGARQYDEMVTAAAQLVSSVNAGANNPLAGRRYRDELVNATDRLQGWAQAYHELGQLRGA